MCKVASTESLNTMQQPISINGRPSNLINLSSRSRFHTSIASRTELAVLIVERPPPTDMGSTQGFILLQACPPLEPGVNGPRDAPKGIRLIDGQPLAGLWNIELSAQARISAEPCAVLETWRKPTRRGFPSPPSTNTKILSNRPYRTYTS